MVATNLVIALAVWRIFASAADRSGLSLESRRRIRVGTALFLGGWLGLALLLAPAPDSLLGHDRFYLTPLIPLLNLAAFTAVFTALRLSPPLRRVIAAASLPAMHGVQFYRVIGATFVLLLTMGQLPPHFALPAGWGDVAIGIAAPLVAFALARGATGALALAVGWNVLGLLDLIVAVAMGTGYLAPFLAPALGPQVPPTAAMGVFPLILVPTFAVPVSVMLHLLTLGRLRQARVAPGLVPTPAA